MTFLLTGANKCKQRHLLAFVECPLSAPGPILYNPSTCVEGVIIRAEKITIKMAQLWCNLKQMIGESANLFLLM